jgi:hypothetical protein
MRKSPFTIVVAVLATLAVGTRAHGILAPTKGSQLVTVYASGTCPMPGFNPAHSATFNQMVRADGSVVPFVIPAKQIFVLVDVQMTISGQPAADTMLSVVAVGTPSAGAPIASRFDSAEAGGTMTATFEFPAGVAVKSTAAICAELLNLTHSTSYGVTATAHGFFAPDK